MTKLLKLVICIFAISCLANSCLCDSAEESYSFFEYLKFERRLSCQLKAKPGLWTQNHLICLANLTESNLDEKTLSSRFVQLVGPEVSEFISANGMDVWETFVCKHVEKTLQMAQFNWRHYISLLGPEGFGPFLVCLHDKFDELKYQEVCVRKNEGLRKLHVMKTRCLHVDNPNDEKSTQIVKETLQDSDKFVKSACESKETFSLKWGVSEPDPEDRLGISKYVECLRSLSYE